MAMPDRALPYGLREVVLTPVGVDGTLGTSVKLPAAQTFSFSEEEEFQTLRGDDTVQAIHGQGATVAWDLEAGGISLAAWKVITGGTVTLTGTTPNQVHDFTKTSADTRPYFQVEGRALNDNGGDTHGVIYRARCTDSLEGEFSDGEFFVTSCSGEGIPGLGDNADKLYSFIFNETATPAEMNA